METKITEALEILIGYVKGMGEFAQAQAPLLVREMTSYAIWGGLLAILIVTGISIGYGYGLRMFFKYFKDQGDDFDDHLGLIFGLSVGGLFVVIGIALILFGIIPELIQAIIAPRLYVLGKLGELLK